MDKQTLTHQIGQAAGILVRLEQDLGRAKHDLTVAIRDLTAGGGVLLIGIIALIVYFVLGTQCTVAIAAAGLVIGGLMVIVALVKIRGAHRSIDTITDEVAHARAELEGLKAQLPVAE
jgi:peptidoglycan/LPS O-acetylase OafA/YrhL